MTQQTEKICFRYDGSEEAKKCIEWINETHQMSLCGSQTFYHSLPENGNFGAEKPRYGYRLVTPAEFLRLVSGEPEWTPKYGEEVEGYDVINRVWIPVKYGCPDINGQGKHIVFIKDGDVRVASNIRPIRKSVREELVAMLWGICEASVKADEILSKFNVTPKD